METLLLCLVLLPKDAHMAGGRRDQLLRRAGEADLPVVDDHDLVAHREDILCPELSAILDGREASYSSLRTAFAAYCAQADGPVNLCGLSLGGILALDYTLEHPETVKTLVLIGTPHKVPRAAFALQNIVFRLLPKSMFASMAFDKRDTFALGNSMKNLDFSGSVHEIRCPTLILCGEKDSTNIKSARFLAQNIQGAELQILTNTGHVVNEEAPKALAERLNAFYAAHP